MVKLCSPLNNNGEMTWYFQHSTCLGSALTTVQCNFISLEPEGTVISTRAPTSTFPIAWVISGFHSGYLAKSVRIYHTFSGGAWIWISVWSVFTFHSFSEIWQWTAWRLIWKFTKFTILFPLCEFNHRHCLITAFIRSELCHPEGVFPLSFSVLRPPTN